MRRSVLAAGGAIALAILMLGGFALPSGALSASADSGSTATQAAPRYKVVKLGKLAGDEYAVPYGINERGDVVGYSGGQIVAFVTNLRTGERLGVRLDPKP